MTKLNYNYVKELVQVAAVALAAAQTFMYGDSALDLEGELRLQKLLHDVLHERKRQEEKWGTRFEVNHAPEHWLTILTEEVGEVADEILQRNVWASHREGEQYLTEVMSRVGGSARHILESN